MTRPLIALAAATALLTGLSGVSGTAVAEAGLSSSLSAPGLFLAAAEARTALRRTTTVDSEVVRLGDVFDGAGPEASVTIATAPAPGERLVLEARTLGALARRYGLDWTPASTADRVVVLRASDTVGSADILSALEDAMRGQGLPAGLEIELGGGLEPIAIPTNTLERVVIADLSVDLRAGRFSSHVEVAPGTPQARRLRLSGRVFETLEIPVPVRAVNRGDVIGPHDLRWQVIRTNQVQAGILTTPGEMVGMAATRSLRPGDMIRVRDVERPVLVSRGSLVTMSLRTAFMTLSAQGRALENGSVGDVVRVRNLRSNQTVLGTVTADGSIIVDGPHGGQTAAAIN